MKLLHLTLKNFTSHSETSIDLSSLSSAVIIGKGKTKRNSNGVGKSSIFRAIEYVLFNECDAKLEELIRDGTDRAEVILIFSVDDIVYKVHRTRHRKGQTDLSLFKKTKEWEDISSRRASDTEKDLEKLIKITFTSFRNTVHFVQKDMNGLATLTSEKRKAALKEGLNLSLYPKLEKLAKEKANLLEIEITKSKTILDTFVGNKDFLIQCENKSLFLVSEITRLELELIPFITNLSSKKEEAKTLQETIDKLSANKNAAIEKSASLKQQVKKLVSSLAIVQNIIKSQENTISSLKKEIESKKKDVLKIKISGLEEVLQEVKDYETELQQILSEGERKKFLIETISVPVTSDVVCASCRQEVSEAHRVKTKAKLDKQLIKEKENLVYLKEEYSKTKSVLSEKKLEAETIRMNVVKKEAMIDKAESLEASLHQSKELVFSQQQEEKRLLLLIEEAQAAVLANEQMIQNSSDAKGEELKISYQTLQNELETLSSQVKQFESHVRQKQSELSVSNHQIADTKDKLHREEELTKKIVSLSEEYEIYPEVIKAFSSTGIPNLIIQNILDDLQTEANSILSKIKPELSLTFSTEKENSKGELVEKLDILYTVDGFPRDYSLISGAQKVGVNFALKLGFSHLLQRMMGVNLEFLLVDEVDESLDEAGEDDFAEIIKILQKEVLVLVITHNNQLKDKFSDAILVEQDSDRVSKGKIISW